MDRGTVYYKQTKLAPCTSSVQESWWSPPISWPLFQPLSWNRKIRLSTTFAQLLIAILIVKAFKLHRNCCVIKYEEVLTLFYVKYDMKEYESLCWQRCMGSRAVWHPREHAGRWRAASSTTQALTSFSCYRSLLAAVAPPPNTQLNTVDTQQIAMGVSTTLHTQEELLLRWTGRNFKEKLSQSDKRRRPLSLDWVIKNLCS